MRKNVKQYVVFCMILFVSIPVCAQYEARKANYYYKNRWKENIFVSAGFGGMAAMSSYNLKAGVGQMLNPYFNVSAGSHINPFWAWRAGLDGWRVSEAGISPEKQITSFVDLRADLMCNLVNAFGGFDGGHLHLVDVFVYAGPYLNFAGGVNPGVTCGGLIKFNVSKYLAIDIDGRLSRQRNMTYGQYDRFYMAATVGVSYVFGGRRF